MRALVLGGSGHVGNAVVRALLARGDAVTVARRGQTPADNLRGLAVAEVLGDADDAVGAWAVGHDAIIDAAAPYPWTLVERAAVVAARRRATAIVAAISETPVSTSKAL